MSGVARVLSGVTMVVFRPMLIVGANNYASKSDFALENVSGVKMLERS